MVKNCPSRHCLLDDEMDCDISIIKNQEFQIDIYGEYKMNGDGTH